MVFLYVRECDLSGGFGVFYLNLIVRLMFDAVNGFCGCKVESPSYEFRGLDSIWKRKGIFFLREEGPGDFRIYR